MGGPTFRSSHSDYLLQKADLIAHALVKREEEPSPRVERLGIDRAHGTLAHALNRRAPRRAPARRQAVRDYGGCADLGRENVPRKVLT